METRVCSYCWGTGVDYAAQRAADEAEQRARYATKQAAQTQKQSSTTRETATTQAKRLKGIDYVAGLVAGLVAYSYLLNHAGADQGAAGLGAVVTAILAIYLWKAAIIIAVIGFIVFAASQHQKNSRSPSDSIPALAETLTGDVITS
jgi:hypothetical protein